MLRLEQYDREYDRLSDQIRRDGLVLRRQIGQQEDITRTRIFC